MYGPGTQGQGDQCAPSRQFNQGIHWSPWQDIAFNYEELFVATMVARGFAIVMTDDDGLGTSGTHTYVTLASSQSVRHGYPQCWFLLPDQTWNSGPPEGSSYDAFMSSTDAGK